MLSSEERNKTVIDKENVTSTKKKSKRTTVKSRSALAKNDGVVNSNAVKKDVSTTKCNGLASKAVKKDRGNPKTSETSTAPKVMLRRSHRKPAPQP